MADVTGTLHHDFGGKSITLRLTWTVLAELQARHGKDFIQRLEIQEGEMPDFGMIVDIVTRALMRGENMPESDAALLADDMLTADPSMLGRLMKSAFPEAQAAGNGAKAGQAARKR